MKWKALVLLFGVFILGIGSGFLLDRLAFHPVGMRSPMRRAPERLLDRLTAKLDLSDEQRAEVRTILYTTRTELATLHRTVRQQVDGVLATSESRIQALLKPQQREAFQVLMAEHRARHQRWHKRRFRRRLPPPDSGRQ